MRPAILVVVLFTAVILVHGLRNPLPPPERIPLRTKIAGLVDLAPTVTLILVVGHARADYRRVSRCNSFHIGVHTGDAIIILMVAPELALWLPRVSN